MKKPKACVVCDTPKDGIHCPGCCTPALRRLVRAAERAPHAGLCPYWDNKPCRCWKRSVSAFRREREGK
jgi:hypothetical protein